MHVLRERRKHAEDQYERFLDFQSLKLFSVSVKRVFLFLGVSTGDQGILGGLLPTAASAMGAKGPNLV